MSTTITVNWAPVTTNVDGGLLLSAIAHYEVSHYVGDAPIYGTQPSVLVPAGQNSVDIPGVPNGKMGVRLRAVDAIGRRSPWTAWATGDTTDTPPAAPTAVTATFTLN